MCKRSCRVINKVKVVNIFTWQISKADVLVLKLVQLIKKTTSIGQTDNIGVMFICLLFSHAQSRVDSISRYLWCIHVF